jgi:hypothetical protein
MIREENVTLLNRCYPIETQQNLVTSHVNLVYFSLSYRYKCIHRIPYVNPLSHVLFVSSSFIVKHWNFRWVTIESMTESIVIELATASVIECQEIEIVRLLFSLVHLDLLTLNLMHPFLFRTRTFHDQRHRQKTMASHYSDKSKPMALSKTANNCEARQKISRQLQSNRIIATHRLWSYDSYSLLANQLTIIRACIQHVWSCHRLWHFQVRQFKQADVEPNRFEWVRCLYIVSDIDVDTCVCTCQHWHILSHMWIQQTHKQRINRRRTLYDRRC